MVKLFGLILTNGYKNKRQNPKGEKGKKEKNGRNKDLNELRSHMLNEPKRPHALELQTQTRYP